MQIFVRAFLLGVRLGMKTNVVVVRRENVFNPSNCMVCLSELVGSRESGDKWGTLYAVHTSTRVVFPKSLTSYTG